MATGIEINLSFSKNFIFTPVVLALAFVFNITQLSAIKLKCTNIDEFYYPTPGSYCSGFYKCTSRGYNDAKECPLGMKFDFYAQTCTRSSGICYEPICTGRTNGIYQDTTSACRRSFHCHSGNVINVDNCPPVHLHNGQQCVSQDLVSCELPYNTAIGYPFSGDQRCNSYLDGSYGIDDCSKYIICRNQEVVDIKKCQHGYRYKNDQRQCVLANQVPVCPNNFINEQACRDQHDGMHLDPTINDCSGYVICRNGKFVSRQKCSNQAIFNGYNCVPAPLFTCSSAIWNIENDICKKHTNGFYMNPQQGCSSYVRCINGRTVELFECPNGQYFDPDESNCAYEKFDDRHKCKIAKRSQDCNNKAQSFYQEIDCQKYYHCINGMKTEYECPPNKLFNGNACVSKGRYICPSNEPSTCINKSDGYYKDKEAGCRGYYYCSNGNKISYLCEEGHLFNGETCIRNNQPNRCKSDTVCHGKSDGYHSDVKSNCRNYVYCVNDEKVTQLTCRDNKIFNGVKCVSGREYACPSLLNHHQLNCMPRKCNNNLCSKDGFYPDIESNCENYFFCIGGKRTTLSCSAGQIFNGEICVAMDKFSCPVYCSSSNQSNDDSCPLSGY